MADLSQKVPENVVGRFYVDATCIDCDLCRETAPANFLRLDDEGYSYSFDFGLSYFCAAAAGAGVAGTGSAGTSGTVLPASGFRWRA